MEETFRPSFGRGLVIATAATSVTIVIFVATTSGLADALLTAPWTMLFTALCYALYWRPEVVVSDGGVVLVNVTRTIHVPWPAITGIETRYALTLETVYGRYAAWAAPAPSAGKALRASARHRAVAAARGHDAEVAVTKGEMPDAASGDAAALIRRRWERLRDDGFLDEPRIEFERPPIRWAWNVAAAIVALTALSLVSLFVG